MKTYQATARRDGSSWVVRVDGVGVTQGRSVDEAQIMAVDLVSIMEEIPLDRFEARIEFEDLGDDVKSAD